MTPTTTTHARASLNRAPVSPLATMSPMSTNPPMAVRIPSVISTTFFMGARSLVPLREVLELAGVVVEGLGLVGQLRELAPTGRDADLAYVVEGVADELVELLLERVGPLVRGLDGVERALGAAHRLLG